MAQRSVEPTRRTSSSVYYERSATSRTSLPASRPEQNAVDPKQLRSAVCTHFGDVFPRVATPTRALLEHIDRPDPPPSGRGNGAHSRCSRTNRPSTPSSKNCGRHSQHDKGCHLGKPVGPHSTKATVPATNAGAEERWQGRLGGCLASGERLDPVPRSTSTALSTHVCRVPGNKNIAPFWGLGGRHKTPGPPYLELRVVIHENRDDPNLGNKRPCPAHHVRRP